MRQAQGNVSRLRLSGYGGMTVCSVEYTEKHSPGYRADRIVPSALFFTKPGHSRTGSRGYFG
jgi:hypothetical protein